MRPKILDLSRTVLLVLMILVVCVATSAVAQNVSPALSAIAAQPAAPAQAAVSAQSTAPAQSAAPAQSVAPAPAVAPSGVATQAVTPAQPASRPAAPAAPRVPAPGWTGYRSVTQGMGHSTTKPTTKVDQSRSGWRGYAPAAGWSGYRRPATVRPNAPAATTGHPALNMKRSKVPGPNPYADKQPRSYHEYGSGRRVSVAKPWLPGSP